MVLSILSLFLLLALLLSGYLSVIRVERDVWILAGIAFLLRVGFAIANQSVGLISPADESAYHATLTFVAQQWHSGVLDAPLSASSGPGVNGLFSIVYSFILGPIYTIFGSEMLHARLAMALFGALVVVNLYLIASRLHSHRGGLYAAAIAAFFPYWVYLSGILYRDMMIIFFFTLMFYGVIRMQRNSVDMLTVSLVVLCGLFGLSLRLVNVFAVGAAAAAFVYTRSGKRAKQWIALAVVATGSLAVLAILFGDTISVQGLAQRRLWLARESAASYLTGFAYESLLEMLIFLPLGALYFTFVPFPWQTPNTLSLLALAQNLLFWYPIAALAVLGARDAGHGQFGVRQTLPLVAFAVAGLVGYGLVEGNLGPAMRHRSQFQFVFFVLAGIALSKRIRISVFSEGSRHREPAGG